MAHPVLPPCEDTEDWVWKNAEVTALGRVKQATEGDLVSKLKKERREGKKKRWQG